MLGTASVVRAFLLVEFPGAWGESALRDARLPDGVGSALARESSRHGVKTLLIRRHGRTSVPDRPRVFAAYAHPTRPWMETATVPSLDALLDLDLASLTAGSSTGLEPTDEPVFAVCTHGRHDACCAERGRPVSAAMAAIDPQRSWEVSHIGGDRFAPSLLVLPHGLYYGRVGPDRVGRLIRDHLDGLLTPDLLRGRSAYPFVVQAAEHYLRSSLGEARIDAVRLVRRHRPEHPHEPTATWHVGFTADGHAWTVRLHARDSDPMLLTCHALTPSPAPVFTLLGIDES